VSWRPLDFCTDAVISVVTSASYIEDSSCPNAANLSRRPIQRIALRYVMKLTTITKAAAAAAAFMTSQQSILADR